MTPPASSPRLRPHRLRRLAGVLLTSGAVAFGGVAALPSGLAQAAGADGGRLRHLATSPDVSPSPTTATTTNLSATPQRATMRLRVDRDGRVLPG